MGVIRETWLRIKAKASAFDASISAPTLTANRSFSLPDVDGILSVSNDGEPNGFTDRTQVTPTWSNATRTLTLTPVSTDFSIWSNGKHFLKTTVSFQISDVEGQHYIYFDVNGELAETNTFNNYLIDRWCYVAALYWDATNKVVISGNPFNEMHGKDMPSSVHSYLHRTQGTRYISGFGVVANAIGNGTLAEHCQFSVASGVSQDEDIIHSHIAKALTGNIYGIYLSGTNWRQTQTSYAVLTTGTGRAAYNQNVGGNWQLTEVPNNNFVLSHLLAIPGVSISTGSFIFVVGQASYTTLASAQAAALTERNSLVTSGLPFAEFVWIATLIVKTATSYSNAVKSAFVQTSGGESYVNWLNTTTSSGGSASNHNALGGLQGGVANEYYHLTLAEYNKLIPTINAQAGNYTAVLTDANSVTIDMTSASANTFTIPTNASVAFPVGSSLTVFRSGAGVTTIQATTGVILNGTSGASRLIEGRYQGVLLQKKATDTWYIFNK
jgi:hypothetical protein